MLSDYGMILTFFILMSSKGEGVGIFHFRWPRYDCCCCHEHTQAQIQVRVSPAWRLTTVQITRQAKYLSLSTTGQCHSCFKR